MTGLLLYQVAKSSTILSRFDRDHEVDNGADRRIDRLTDRRTECPQHILHLHSVGR